MTSPPPSLYVDVSYTSVGGELNDLPASVTYVDVAHTSVRGEFKDLPASVVNADHQFLRTRSCHSAATRNIAWNGYNTWLPKYVSSYHSLVALFEQCTISDSTTFENASARMHVCTSYQGCS